MAWPRLIALCGNPGSGKTTACEILRNVHGYEIADDGLPLRQIAMTYLGLKEHQVFTQAGKLETVTLNGRDWECRKVLGELGNAFEEKFGGDVIPMMAHMIQDPTKRYVMGSVRREQGRYWKKAGAVVLEIVNPAAPVSKFEFDTYNPGYVDYRVVNDALHDGFDPGEARRILGDRLQVALDMLA